MDISSFFSSSSFDIVAFVGVHLVGFAIYFFCRQHPARAIILYLLAVLDFLQSNVIAFSKIKYDVKGFLIPVIELNFPLVEVIWGLAGFILASPFFMICYNWKRSGIRHGMVFLIYGVVITVYCGYIVGQQPEDGAGKIALSMLALIFLGGITIMEFKRSFLKQQNMEPILENLALIEIGIPTERVMMKLKLFAMISVEIAGFTENIILLGNWKDAELHPQILKNLKKHSKYFRPLMMQSAAMSFILDGYDVKI